MKSLRTFRAGLYLPAIFLFSFFFLFNAVNAQVSSCGCDPSTNMIPDGDFEIPGNTLPAGVSNSLIHLCDCNYPGSGTPGYGSYCVETDAHSKCTSFDHVFDHTSGAGKFLIVDGFPDTDPPTLADPNIVWKYGVNFLATGTYEFSFWWHPNMSSSTTVLPVLDFRVDNVILVSGIGGSSATLNQWNEFCTTFTITTPGYYAVEIGQSNTGGGSNDYGIDDVFLGNCCTCDVTADFTATQTGAYNVNFTSTSTSNSCTNISYYWWDFGDGNSADGPGLASVSNNYPGPGNYPVLLTVMGFDANGMECFDEILIDVFVDEWDPECNVTANMSLSGNISMINVTNNSFDPIAIDQWTFQIYDPPYNPSSYSSYSGFVPSGTDASVHTNWNVSHPAIGPGTYWVYLCVYDTDYDPNDPLACYNCFLDEIVIDEDNIPDCDVVADFNSTQAQPGSASYSFVNTSTASSPLTHYWKVTDITTATLSIIHTDTNLNLNYTFPGNGIFEVCLRETQLDVGTECLDIFCDTITIDNASNYLGFDIGYHCNDPEPTLFISNLLTNASWVDISTNCPGGSANPTPGGNVTGLGMPVTPPNYDVATQPSYDANTCTICVTDANGLNVCKTIWFNCQACPGSPRAPGLSEKPIKENKFAQELAVFPNPTDGDEIQVRISEMYGPSELKLIDISGRLVKAFDIDVNFSQIQIPIDISDLSSGVYLIQLKSDQGVQIQKLIIE